MKAANIAELKNNLSHYIGLAEQGETIQICRRNVPVAQVVPVRPGPASNRTQLGCGRQTGRILGDITEPALAESDWEMLRE